MPALGALLALPHCSALLAVRTCICATGCTTCSTSQQTTTALQPPVLCAHARPWQVRFDCDFYADSIITSCLPFSLLPSPYSLLPSPYSLLPTPYSLLPTPYSLLPSPYSLLPTPYSLLPPFYSLLPTPYSLFRPTHLPGLPLSPRTAHTHTHSIPLHAGIATIRERRANQPLTPALLAGPGKVRGERRLGGKGDIQGGEGEKGGSSTGPDNAVVAPSTARTGGLGASRCATCRLRTGRAQSGHRLCRTVRCGTEVALR
ncbi:unnamed protein product [Closterium sp. NIES-54]